MNYANRIFLSWDEAASALGMDNEGLRQAMLYRFSPEPWESQETWLPVTLVTKGEGFMTDFYADGYHGPTWNGRDQYYRVFPNGVLRDVDGNIRQLHIDENCSMPVKGMDNFGNRWEATHGYDANASRPFVLDGDALIVSPESIRAACKNDGYFRSILIAPRGWCEDGFPAFRHFRIVFTPNNVYDQEPDSLYQSALFRSSDVQRLMTKLEASSSQGKDICSESVPGARDAPLDPRREKSLLRVIRALDVMAGLPSRGAASSIEVQLQQLGFLGPNDDTIREILKDARSLDSDKS